MHVCIMINCYIIIIIRWSWLFHCVYRHYKYKIKAVDQTVSTPLNSAVQPLMTTYMEFDEYNENFQLVSERYKQESEDL